MRFDYHVKIWYRSDIPRRRYYDFIILPLWLENHAPFLEVFGGFEPLNIVGGHSNPQKTHPWVTTRHLSHKWLNSVQEFDLGGVARKKSITRSEQDWTTKKSQKRNISHLGESSPLRYCNEIWRRGRCPRGTYVGRVWSLKFKWCKFYRGLKFGLLRWLCLWALTQCSATALPVIG